MQTAIQKPMIEIDGVTKLYGSRPVLQDASLTVMQGEIVTLLGANGAGKSTLLRIIATLLKPTKGSVKVGGWFVGQHDDKIRPHIGFLSHEAFVYGDVSAEINLTFFANLYKIENPKESVYSALKTVGLTASLNDPVRTFSRGMLQRLAIARSVLHNPDIWLLDEPYSGLDPTAVELLDELIAESNRTILLVTHNIPKGEAVADKVVRIEKGRIIT